MSFTSLSSILPIFIIFISANNLFSVSGIVCLPNACENITCPQLNAYQCAENGQMFVENGGFCGCCNTCVGVIALGQPCAITEIKGVPPPAICTPGTECINDTCQYPPNASPGTVPASPCQDCSIVRCLAVEKFTCETNATKKFIPSDACRCCDACVDKIQPGGCCDGYLNGIPLSTLCVDGTECKSGVCELIHAGCIHR